MRTFRSYTIVALAVMGLATAAPLLAQPSQSSDQPTSQQVGSHFPGTDSWRANHPSDLLTGKQLKALLATARTPADHVTLQKHFLALAARSDAKAAEHSAMAENRNPGSHFPGTASSWAKHCDRISRSGREAAREARVLASEHEQMATAVAANE